MRFDFEINLFSLSRSSRAGKPDNSAFKVYARKKKAVEEADPVNPPCQPRAGEATGSRLPGKLALQSGAGGKGVIAIKLFDIDPS